MLFYRGFIILNQYTQTVPHTNKICMSSLLTDMRHKLQMDYSSWVISLPGDSRPTIPCIGAISLRTSYCWIHRQTIFLRKLSRQTIPRQIVSHLTIPHNLRIRIRIYIFRTHFYFINFFFNVLPGFFNLCNILHF